MYSRASAGCNLDLGCFQFVAAKKAEDAGQPQSVAMAEAIPGLVAAMSKTMACKEMCEAAVSSCSCKADGSDVLTFGEAITNAEQIEDGFQKVLHVARCLIILFIVFGVLYVPCGAINFEAVLQLVLPDFIIAQLLDIVLWGVVLWPSGMDAGA